MARTLIFPAPSFPQPVCSFFAANGYRMLEAHSPVQAEDLANDHDVDALLIVGKGSGLALQELRRHLITMDLAPNATGPEIYFELSHLFPVNLSLH